METLRVSKFLTISKDINNISKLNKMMRKFLSMIAALLMVFAVSANAQTVESSRMFENISVTVDGGAVSSMLQPFDTTFFKNIKGSAGFGIDKYFTPVVGIGIQGIANFNHDFEARTLDRAYGIVNGKINFSNWFGGYKGQPRRVEVVGFAGMGYGHNFSDAKPEEQPVVAVRAASRSNAVSPRPQIPNAEPVKHFTVYDAGLELNFNIGEERAWQINVKPTVLWNNETAVYPKLSIRDADVRLTAGVTYKFGSRSKKSHNFVLCPFSITQEEYDALQAKYDDLANRPPVTKEVVREVIRTERVIEKETKVLMTSTVITFPIGSAVLSEVEREKVGIFAKSLDGETLIQLVGSADSGTGSEARNQMLAENRANVVKNILTDVYGIAPSRITVNTQMDATENAQTSRAVVLSLHQ